MVGYALGNKSSEGKGEDEIRVLGEDSPGVITYSTSATIGLYGYAHKKYSSLTIPYKTIKEAKNIRLHGVREVVYDVFHRPDKSPLLRTMLDLWGFDSYVDYLYTICELGFLEGVIPVIDFGFLTPDEMTQLYDVFAIVKNPLFSDYDQLMDMDGIRSLDRSLDIHQKLLTWSVKLGFPTSTGFYLYDKMTIGRAKEYALYIADIIKNYNVIHEVVLTTRKRCPELPNLPASFAKEKRIYEVVREIIPHTVPVLFTEPSIECVDMLLSNNEKDLGAFDFSFLNSDKGAKYWEQLEDCVAKRNGSLQQRFPLRKSFIQNHMYSKKLGQVFDSYKYKIKKDLLEKQRESK
ncbi:hypothetical protein DID78_05175 [Candidatus Marinamargulisbacteria bacterium SCGC AG-343-D04]|nr:hypothetical protein DID78_05175 [Candidatus Marinamargulisbacteria bacterium SCGC AG-343-D04]